MTDRKSMTTKQGIAIVATVLLGIGGLTYALVTTYNKPSAYSEEKPQPIVIEGTILSKANGIEGGNTRIEMLVELENKTTIVVVLFSSSTSISIRVLPPSIPFALLSIVPSMTIG